MTTLDNQFNKLSDSDKYKVHQHRTIIIKWVAKMTSGELMNFSEHSERELIKLAAGYVIDEKIYQNCLTMQDYIITFKGLTDHTKAYTFGMIR